MIQHVHTPVLEKPASLDEVWYVVLRRLQPLAARLQPEALHAFIARKVTVRLPIFFALLLTAARPSTSTLFVEHSRPFFCSSTHAPGSLSLR